MKQINFAMQSLQTEKLRGRPTTRQIAAFGLSPHFRISYATSDELLEAACTRIAEFAASLKG